MMMDDSKIDHKASIYRGEREKIRDVTSVGLISLTWAKPSNNYIKDKKFDDKK